MIVVVVAVAAVVVAVVRDEKHGMLGNFPESFSWGNHSSSVTTLNCCCVDLSIWKRYLEEQAEGLQAVVAGSCSSWNFYQNL